MNAVIYIKTKPVFSEKGRFFCAGFTVANLFNFLSPPLTLIILRLLVFLQSRTIKRINVVIHK